MTQITVAEYLVKRLYELGISDFFGVPGDFNFNVIEAVEKNPDTNWIGCCNELNAGYAADGYARTKGYAALVTTFGVGELSAVNAVAGSYSENVPVIKISGTPNTKTQKNASLIHHTLGNGDFDVFRQMYKHVSEANTVLTAQNAVSEIERVLSVAVNEKKPVYIAIAEDVCNEYIDDNFALTKKRSEGGVLTEVTTKIIQKLKSAKKPVILSDSIVFRFNLENKIEKLINTLQIPASVLYMGKGSIDENHPLFLGVYSGQLLNKDVANFVEDSDCILSLGAMMTDFNAGAYTSKLNPDNFVQINKDNVVIDFENYANVLITDVIDALIEKNQSFKYDFKKPECSMKKSSLNDNDKLCAENIYPMIEEFLREDDLIVAETGTVSMGLTQAVLPKGCKFFTQALWGSIGWATPAALGVGIAARDKRLLLITGDGSLQLTAQEISSMVRFGLKPIIIVLNNDGYTIERILSKDPMDPFNDIADWDYCKLPGVFKADCYTKKAKTLAEFKSALETCQSSNKMCFVEIFAEKMDVPEFTANLHKNLTTLYNVKTCI